MVKKGEGVVAVEIGCGAESWLRTFGEDEWEL